MLISAEYVFNMFYLIFFKDNAMNSKIPWSNMVKCL